MQEHLLRLQRDLTKLRTQSGVDQAALCEAAVLAQHSSVQVNSTEAELLVVQTAAGAAALEATQREAQLLQLTTQVRSRIQVGFFTRARPGTVPVMSPAGLQASDAVGVTDKHRYTSASPCLCLSFECDPFRDASQHHSTSPIAVVTFLWHG